MSSQNCAGCSKLLPKHEFLRCSVCKAAFDLDCLNMSQKRYNSFYAANKESKIKWKCPECVSKQPKHGNLETPVRSNAACIEEELDIHNVSCDESQNVTQRAKKSNVAAGQGLRLSKDTGFSIQCDDPFTAINLYLNEMRAMRSEMSVYHNTMADLANTIKAQNRRIEKLESRMDVLETKSAECKHDEILALEEAISQLKSEIQERDQEVLNNDKEISNFPESMNENVTHIVLTVAMKLGVELDERDVVTAERAGPVRALVEGVSPRPRPLVVRLARHTLRNALLQAAGVRRGLTTEGMAVPDSPRPYYVNERLTRVNRQWFLRAREMAKNKSWKYVWTREGRIYARREHGTPSFRIRSDSDIAKVFCVNIVSAVP